MSLGSESRSGPEGGGSSASGRFTLDSFSDQEITAADKSIASSTSGSAASHQTHENDAGDLLTVFQQDKSYTIPNDMVDEGVVYKLNTDLDDLCETAKDSVSVMPKSMEDYLSLHHKNIIPLLKKQCQVGDVMYIAHSLGITLKIDSTRPVQSLVCDVCIFSKQRPFLIITLTSDRAVTPCVEAYNAKVAQAVTELTRVKHVPFTLTNGVLKLDDFCSNSHLASKIKNIVKDSSFAAPTGSLQMTETKFKWVFRVFLERLCRWFHRTTEIVFFTEYFFHLLSELLEERRNVEIRAPSRKLMMLLIKELVIRFSLAGKSSRITIQCPEAYVEDVEQFSKHIEVKVHKGKDVILTSKWTEPARWTFFISKAETAGIQTPLSPGEEDTKTNLMDKAKARRSIVAGIIDKSCDKEKLTKEELKKIEATMCFSLKQFEDRACIFLTGLVDSGLKADDIEQRFSFMEDYLMQCFRQRNIQLDQKPKTESDFDTHMQSIRRLTPILNSDLRLEGTSLMDRLIHHDVMSEAGRQSIMGRSTVTSRNKAFVTYLCGNFTSETFKAQFLPLLSEDQHNLAKRLEDEMDRLTIASRRKEKCTFCKMKETVNIRRLLDALYQMNEITESMRKELSASSLPNAVKWTELFKHVRNVEGMMKALELKNEHFHKEFIRKGHSCIECTCDKSESQRLSYVVESEEGKAEEDVANLEDFADEDILNP